jgi:5-formyltetrahydrofolate cyclo-ligase
VEKTLNFFPVRALSELVPGSYQIPEPPDRTEKNLSEIDLIFVPGVVFDPSGNRLGFGQGFYDRVLSPLAKKKNKVGLAFAFQIVPRIPIPDGSKDIPMDWIITDQQCWEI